jgi:hypothetical protein
MVNPRDLSRALLLFDKMNPKSAMDVLVTQTMLTGRED